MGYRLCGCVMCVLTGYLCGCVLCVNCLVLPGVSLRGEAGLAHWLTEVFAGVSEYCGVLLGVHVGMLSYVDAWA